MISHAPCYTGVFYLKMDYFFCDSLLLIASLGNRVIYEGSYIVKSGLWVYKIRGEI